MSKQFLMPFFSREINAGENASVIKSPPIHLVMPPQSCVRLQSNIDLPNIFKPDAHRNHGGAARRTQMSTFYRLPRRFAARRRVPRQITSVGSSAGRCAVCERIDPGDPSLTGIECLLKEVSILGTSAAAKGQLAPPTPDHCNREERRGAPYSP